MAISIPMLIQYRYQNILSKLFNYTKYITNFVNSSIPPDLDIARYCLTENDIVQFKDVLFTDKQSGTIQEAVAFLKSVYSDHITAEFSYLEVSW